MVNICIYNHPSKHQAKEDHKVVVVLVHAPCTKHGWLWRSMVQAWFLKYIKSEATMLVNGILSSGLQSRRLIDFHGPWILQLKRFIMEAQCLFSIKVESNIVWASGNRLKLGREWWWSLAFTKVKRVFQVILLRSRKFYNLSENGLKRCERRYMHHLLEWVLLGKRLLHRTF